MPQFQRSQVGALRLWMRGIKQTTMSSELDSGTFKHAKCVLLVEVQLSVPTRLGQALEPLENGKVANFQRRQMGVLRLWMKGTKQTTMSSELEADIFEHAGCVLLVEI